MRASSSKESDIVDRIARVRKQIREFRGKQERLAGEDIFTASTRVANASASTGTGIGTSAAGGAGAGATTSARPSLKSFLDQGVMLVPNAPFKLKPSGGGADGAHSGGGHSSSGADMTAPNDQFSSISWLPSWPKALRASMFGGWTVGLDFLSANGTLWKLTKRPDPTGLATSSPDAICVVLETCESGQPVLYLSERLSLVEQPSEAAVWLILRHPTQPALPPGDDRKPPIATSQACFITLASSLQPMLASSAANLTKSGTAASSGDKNKSKSKLFMTASEVASLLASDHDAFMNSVVLLTSRSQAAISTRPDTADNSVVMMNKKEAHLAIAADAASNRHSHCVWEVVLEVDPPGGRDLDFIFQDD